MRNARWENPGHFSAPSFPVLRVVTFAQRRTGNWPGRIRGNLSRSARNQLCATQDGKSTPVGPPPRAAVGQFAPSPLSGIRYLLGIPPFSAGFQAFRGARGLRVWFWGHHAPGVPFRAAFPGLPPAPLSVPIPPMGRDEPKKPNLKPLRATRRVRPASRLSNPQDTSEELRCTGTPCELRGMRASTRRGDSRSSARPSASLPEGQASRSARCARSSSERSPACTPTSCVRPAGPSACRSWWKGSNPPRHAAGMPAPRPEDLVSCLRITFMAKDKGQAEQLAARTTSVADRLTGLRD